MGLGCMSMSAFYEVDRNEALAIETLQQARKLGVNFFDTADMYGDGTNERLIGKALREDLKNRRSDIIIATKCGFVADSEKGYDLDCSPTHILAACEASLERLGIEYIDLYYLHRLDPKVELEASLDAMVALIRAGKIKGIGLSEVDADTIQKAYDYLATQEMEQHFWAVQTEYNLLSRGPETHGVLDKCEQLGIAFVPYSPLSRSLLTGKIIEESSFSEGDFRTMLPRFQGDNLKANLSIVEGLKAVAREKNCTLPQLALAWILSKRDFIIPIPGSRKIENIKNNMKAGDIHLTKQEIQHIEDIIESYGGVHGDRYTPDMLSAQNIK